MADTMRWRYGDTKPVVCAVDSGTVIEVGDLLYLDTDNVKNANALADAGSLAANQEAFHDAFVGVAMQRSKSGETDPIRVATAGVFEYPQASATVEVGKLMGSVEVSSNDALEDQKVVGVAAENLAIGRCAKRVTSSTTVLVNIESRTMAGGAQAMA